MRCFIGGFGPYLYMASLDPETGALDLVDSVTTPANAAYLVYSPRFRMLYACVETSASSQGPGRVAAYRVDDSGMLTAVGATESCGDRPCHLAVSDRHGLLAVANYLGGTVGMIPLGPDGMPGSTEQCFEHAGSGPNRKRQEQPHPHGVTFSSGGRRLYVCDLGTDEVVSYAPLDPLSRMTREAAVTVAPGSGPRHLVLGGDHAYLVNELSNTVCVFSVEPESGALSQQQEISTLPADYTARNTAAEIALHPSGRHLYVSNRGHDSIGVFHRDPATGLLELSGHFDVTGPSPRHFAIDPTGRWCVVAIHDGNYVSSFALDENTGLGRYSDSVVRVAAPSCVIFSEA